MKAPILVFVYNRAGHTKNLLEKLKTCKEIEMHDLYIFSDGPKNRAAESDVEAVRACLREFMADNCFRSVTVHEERKNKGLANSIIGGVSNIIKQFGTVIVLEDDLDITTDFVSYMQEGLDYYVSARQVGAISGFSFPIKCKKDRIENVYKSRTGNSWGWATWKDRWDQIDWEIADYDFFKTDKALRKKFNFQQLGISEMLDKQMSGEIDSWAVRWDYNFFRKGLWTIYPYSSKVLNKGFDGTGTHCEKQESGAVEMLREVPYIFRDIEKCDDLTRKTSGNTIAAIIKRNMKTVRRKYL